jgi:hypothetical protein
MAGDIEMDNSLSRVLSCIQGRTVVCVYLVSIQSNRFTRAGSMIGGPAWGYLFRIIQIEEL